MPELQNSAGISRVSDVRPGLHLLRRKTDPAPGDDADSEFGMLSAAELCPRRLGQVGAQRSGNTRIGVGPAVYRTWAGRLSGVREPEQNEVKLSRAEVIYGVRHDLFWNSND
jgi:hypothetical protein